MAQQFIKIFDDTVLKQSINQGYETQRTNTRLGNFTMGELAFTRDTGRLFIGNSTPEYHPKDSNSVTGGILSGNKYLGLIDSKPLTHYILPSVEDINTSITTPLSYVNENRFYSTLTDENGIRVEFIEPALFSKDSKFRKDSKNDGWSKEATYNDKYDAYNGDYLYDVYTNAFIFFDKNIKPIEPNSPANWIIDETTEQQKFFIDGNSASGTYSESGSKDNYSTNRTRIQNAVKPNTESQDYTILGNPQYPVYGDGFVIMRIIEPDGKTLGYKEKSFEQSDGTATDGNYSHNYIEIKNLPIDKIAEHLDPKYFAPITIKDENGNDVPTGDKYISFISDELNIQKITGSHLTIPHVVTYNDENFYSSVTITYKASETSIPQEGRYISLIPVTDENNSIKPNEFNAYVMDAPQIKIIHGNYESDTITLNAGLSHNIELKQVQSENKNSLIISDPFFTNDLMSPNIIDDTQSGDITDSYSYNGCGLYNEYGELISVERMNVDSSDEENEVEFSALITSPNFSFVFYDSSSEESTFTENVLEYEKDEEITDTPVQVPDDFPSEFLPQTTPEEGEVPEDEESDEEFSTISEFKLLAKFSHPYISSAINFLKNPRPIAWADNSVTKSYGKFFLFPHICSPKNYHTNMGTLGMDYALSNDEHLEWNKSNFLDESGKLTTIGQEILEGQFDKTFSKPIIPDFAKSVICEIHFKPITPTPDESGESIEETSEYKCLLLTDSDWTMFDTDTAWDGDENFDLFGDITMEETPSCANGKDKISSKFIWQHNSTSSTNVCQQVEFPLYRNKDGMKFFNFCVHHTNGAFVIRVIGYRA